MKTTLAVLIFLGIALAVPNARSQEQAFEVASIRRSPPAEASQSRSTGVGIVSEDPSMISLRQISLKQLLMRAYGLKQFQVNGPDWLDTERYDVSAKLPAGASEGQIPAMLQLLITKRFRMTIRWDTARKGAYVILIDKNGPKLTPTVTGVNDSVRADQARSINLSSAGPIKLNGATTEALAAFLSHAMGQPVLDKTGIQGRFDITLNLSVKDISAARQLSTVPSDDAGYAPTAIFDAVRNLGLRLDPQKTEIKRLTVVRADRVPTEN